MVSATSGGNGRNLTATGLPAVVTVRLRRMSSVLGRGHPSTATNPDGGGWQRSGTVGRPARRQRSRQQPGENVQADSRCASIVGLDGLDRPSSHRWVCLGTRQASSRGEAVNTRTPTVDEIRAWPVTVDVQMAGTAFGIGRDQAYRLANDGSFPVPVLRLGRYMRVTRASVLKALGIEEVAHGPAGPLNAA